MFHGRGLSRFFCCLTIILIGSMSAASFAQQACCLNDGGCQNLDPVDCDDIGGYPLGPGTMCAGDTDMNGIDETCEVLGACCVSDGTCFDLDFSGCVTKQSGLWHGAGTMCVGDINGNGTDDECEPTRACCHPDGTCSEIPAIECIGKFGGLPQGPGSDCAGDLNANGIDDICEDIQACCLPNGTCVDLDVPACLAQGGDPGGEGYFCTALEACCLGDGTCTNLDPACCAAQGGFPGGSGSMCSGNVQACCFLGGDCMNADTFCCDLFDGAPGGPGSACTFTDNDSSGIDDGCEGANPTEACCLPNGTCVALTPVDCVTAGGTPQGPGSVCTTPQGCCLPNGTCANLDPLCCIDDGGTPEGPGSVCTAPQACCLPNGSCTNLDPLCCIDAGGISGGIGSSCDGIQACCTGEHCTLQHGVCCALNGGVPQGPGSLCEPPTITCPADTSVECNTPIDPGVTGTPTVGDDCDGTLTPGFTDSQSPGKCPQEFTITRTWSVTDADGNTVSCEQTITVIDSTPPVITCPVDTSVECGSSTDPSATGSATATDNCDLMPTIGFTDSVEPGECPQEFTITRTWTATDDCGNPNQCVQTISVVDTTDPVITCPGDTSVECGSPTDPGATGSASATDNCDMVVAIGFSDLVTPGDCPQEFTITRTWTATDDCGNTDQCIQTISVVDTTDPVITCPGNTSVQCNTPTDPSVTGSATATDNCDMTVSIGFSDGITPGDCPQEFTITRTWTATDDCGNTDQCVQIIEVADTTDPVINCPTNVEVQCGSPTDPNATGSATATDNCDLDPAISHSDVQTPGDCAQEFTIARTWTATDDCGNDASCVQTISVVDTTPPTVTCMGSVTVQCTGPGGVPVGQVMISGSATDNCDPSVPVTDNRPGGLYPPSCGGTGTIVTFTGIDDCGNIGTCMTEVRVEGAPCCNPQACCLPNGTCTNLLAEDCTAQGGTPRGPGTQCTAPTACCLSGTCQQLDPQCCLAIGGLPSAPGSACLGDPDGDGVDGRCGDACPQNPDLLSPDSCCPNQPPSCDQQDCDTVNCDELEIPTVSEWGLVVMTLLLLVGGTLYFGQRKSATA